MKTLGKYFTDKGYSVNKEFCGYPEKRFVLRFMGDFVVSRETFKETVMDAIIHDDERTFKLL